MAEKESRLNERLGLDKVFQLGHKKAYDILFFWSLDRLSREGSRKTIQYLTQLDDHGVAWHSFTEQYLSSLGVFSDCIISLLSALARQEKIRIGERTKAGLTKARLNGKRLGRHKAGWLELGIRMPTKLRELLTEWFEQRTCERVCERVDLIALRSVNTPQPSA